MADLTVDPAYLVKLAEKQDAVAAAMGAAAHVTDELFGNGPHSVWTTHGCYVGAANRAINDALVARSAAGEAMQAVSSHLAEELRASQIAYLNSDQLAGQNLDKQVRSD